MSYAKLDDIKTGLDAKFEFTDTPAAPSGPLFRPYTWRPPSQIPRREWLYGGHFIRDFLTATFAPGGGGKSTLEIIEAMAMATGRPLLGIMPTGRYRVAYWNGEDPLEETERRVAAAMIHFNIRPEELEGWFFCGSGRESELIIAEQTKDGTIINRPNVERVQAEVAAAGLDLFIIDPFVSSHRVTENDNNAIGMVAKEWGKIAGEQHCGAEMVHHTVKAAMGREVKVEDGRGGGALLFAARSARVLNTMTEEEATAVQVRRRKSYFRVDNGKANLAPPPERSNWYRFLGVTLGNGDPEDPHDPGDSVAVIASWDWPLEVAAVDSAPKPTNPALTLKVVMAAFHRLMDDGVTVPAPPVPGVRPGTLAVRVLDLRNKAIEMGLFPEPKPDREDTEAVKTWQAGARAAWGRGWKSANSRNLLRFENEFVWELRPTDSKVQGTSWPREEP